MTTTRLYVQLELGAVATGDSTIINVAQLLKGTAMEDADREMSQEEDEEDEEEEDDVPNPTTEKAADV